MTQSPTSDGPVARPRTSRLSTLLQTERDAAWPVARYWEPQSRSDRSYGWDALQRHVAGLRERLQRGPEGPWLLLTESAHGFAAGLLALWSEGRYAVSPPNHQPGTLRSLRTRSAGVLTDRPDWFEGASCVNPLEHAAAAAPKQAARLDREALAVELFTSGTTGAEKPVLKRIRHLEDEILRLGERWDEELGNAGVFTTASHQHLYGLLFGVLWPLCAGRVFQAEHFLHPGELLPRMQEGAAVLASVPTHLARLARREDLGGVRETCCRVFSSGGPLSAETAHRIGAALGHAPVEVLGSTETGGVAWRTQQPGQAGDAWTALPSVEVTRDPELGVARVKSPFVSVGEDAGFTTADRIELEPGGGFRLEGRADRTVKVGERRLDLLQMESRLRTHRFVDDVALAAIDRDGEPRVAAAVVPSETGWHFLQRNGRRALGRELAGALADAWDPVLHPRSWRAVHELPRNPQGKVTLDGLAALFEPEAWGELATDRPEILSQQRGDGALERSCRVPEDLPCFAGHFPGDAVVPGALLLGWALGTAAALLGEVPGPLEVETLRLRTPLRPGDRFELRVAQRSRDRLDFRLRGTAGEFASGRVRLGPPGTPA